MLVLETQVAFAEAFRNQYGLNPFTFRSVIKCSRSILVKAMKLGNFTGDAEFLEQKVDHPTRKTGIMLSNIKNFLKMHKRKTKNSFS